MIYMIPEEDELISNCASELGLQFKSDSNSNNNDNDNNSFSSVQDSNINNNDLDSNSNPEQYITLLDLTKEQELKWFSDNNEDIMPECVHNTDAEFDLRYSEKEAIKLESHLCICIDLKINDSEKAYIIEPNKKIAQKIFLPLVKIAQLVSIENRKELGITVKEIQGFRSTDRIDIPVNMTEKENQAQIFEAKTTICKSEKIGLINLYIPAKSSKYIKIFIYNTTGNVFEIPKGTTIGYLSTKIENQLPNTILDFPQLCGYVDITSQTIYRQKECYLFQPKQLE
ncbi:hypothetical protein G9A89_016079 [Geosiphon pyriformis]|nr:hypothetical protein G9A89_016079 [Geosiphon pyriformis]